MKAHRPSVMRPVHMASRGEERKVCARQAVPKRPLLGGAESVMLESMFEVSDSPWREEDVTKIDDVVSRVSFGVAPVTSTLWPLIVGRRRFCHGFFIVRGIHPSSSLMVDGDKVNVHTRSHKQGCARHIWNKH